jgi:hypothetical protein
METDETKQNPDAPKGRPEVGKDKNAGEAEGAARKPGQM